MTEEEIIKQYRLGPNSRVKFKNDPQYYWIKNISLDRKNVFVTINGTQTYKKLIKNIIQIDNKLLLNEMKTKEYRNKKGQLHREDGPAIENADGHKEYYVNGKLHREDGPAIKHANGDKSYFVNGQRHREDGPAVEWANGYKAYWINGQLHREDGPAIEHANGTKSYWVNGKRHREDGPAVEDADGSKEYWVNGERHREDGPAIEHANGTKSYWVNGKRMSEQDFKNRKKSPKSPNNISSTGTQDFKYELKEQIRSIIKEIKEEDKQENVFYDFFLSNSQKLGAGWEDEGFAMQWSKILDNYIKKRKLSLNEKFDGDIKSSLEKIIQQVWAEKDLNKAKSIVINYLKDSKIKDEDKKRMTLELEKITTKGKLDYYLANALLKYEGSGLSQLKKAELKESKIKCQCQKH